MPASATTQNYGLHIYRPGDTCNYLTTYNDDMTTIDAQMKANQTAAAGSVSSIATLEQSVNALDTKVSQLITRMNNIEPMYYPNPHTPGPGILYLGLNITMNRQRCFGTIECQIDSSDWMSGTQITSVGTTKFVTLATFPDNPFHISKPDGITNWTQTGHAITQFDSNLSTEDTWPSASQNNLKVMIVNLGLYKEANITYLVMRMDASTYSGTKEVSVKHVAGVINFLFTHV